MSEVKKKLFVNASTVKISGGLILALGYIDVLCKTNNYEIHLICPKIPEYQRFEDQIHSIKYVPNFILKRFFRWILDYFWLPIVIKKRNPDLILSLGNIPAITSYYQIYLHDNPYLTHSLPLRINLSQLKKVIHLLRVSFTKNRLKHVNEMWTQTGLEQKLIQEKTRFKGHIKVVKPIIPLHLFNIPSKQKYIPDKPQNFIRLICLSNYFEHKNIEILLSVINLAADKKFNIQLVFTLNPKSGRKSSQLVDKINLIPNKMAINIGKVNSQNITHVIKQCDGVILPSLMETFGLNCMDAWMGNKPYLISDRKFAREVCGNSAVYFDPTSPADILKKIEEAYSSNQRIQQLIDSGRKKINEWPNQKSFISQIEKVILK